MLQAIIYCVIYPVIAPHNQGIVPNAKIAPNAEGIVPSAQGLAPNIQGRAPGALTNQGIASNAYR